jgi:hypothetical protein
MRKTVSNKGAKTDVPNLTASYKIAIELARFKNLSMMDFL